MWLNLPERSIICRKVFQSPRTIIWLIFCWDFESVPVKWARSPVSVRAVLDVGLPQHAVADTPVRPCSKACA